MYFIFSVCKVYERDYSLYMKKTGWDDCGKDVFLQELGIKLLSGAEISKRKLVSMIMIVNTCWAITGCQAHSVLSLYSVEVWPSRWTRATTTEEEGTCGHVSDLKHTVDKIRARRQFDKTVMTESVGVTRKNAKVKMGVWKTGKGSVHPICHVTLS